MRRPLEITPQGAACNALALPIGGDCNVGKSSACSVPSAVPSTGGRALLDAPSYIAASNSYGDQVREARREADGAADAKKANPVPLISFAGMSLIDTRLGIRSRRRTQADNQQFLSSMIKQV